MSSCASTGRDPVEMLLRGILARALITSAALAPGCSDGDNPKSDSTDPVDVADTGVLVPTPLPGDASVRIDARVPDVIALDAEADAQLDARALETAYDPCARGEGFPVRADGLSLAMPADYVAVRTAGGSMDLADPGAENWTSSSFEVVSERGFACATATNASCENEVSHHPDKLAQAYCVQACTEWSVVTTRGNDVQRWATPADVLALLGPIDSDDDALMLAASKGYNVSCPPPDAGFLPADADLRYVLQTPDGRELIALRYTETCPLVVRRYRLLITPGGELRELDHVDYPTGACVGRVPAGLEARVGRAKGYGDYLAACAHLEEASVHAFARLADELRAHGAPAALVSRALAAADDEVRHARVVAALASRRGGAVSAARVAALPLRTLEEIAVENAVEGCVRETFGALVGAYQAARAGDAELREAMAEIAEDEARHASLSHDVHAWLAGVLSEQGNARVHAAMNASVEALVRECARDVDASLSASAGLPSAAVASAMVRELQSKLWS